MLARFKADVDAALRRVGARVLSREAKDIPRRMQLHALEETTCFVEEHMFLTRRFPDKFQLLEHALRAVEGTGLFCEFGVYKGETINFIADRCGRTVYGFDSFDGLPEHWIPGFDRGKFKLDRLPDVSSKVVLVKGLFDETLPRFVRETPGSASFLHIDCDLYSSTRTVFEALGDRVVPGTVIVFDEYFNFPGWRQGEFRAFTEFAEAHGLSHEYLGYNGFGEQVAVRITGPAAT